MTGGVPHVLYVAWGFPPCRGSGVHRTLATANALAAEGFRVTVLTVDRDTFARYTGDDPSLEPAVDPRLEVERTRFRWPTLDPEISGWSAARVYAPRLWWHARARLDTVPFPERAYGPWRAELEAAALRVHARRPVDLVLATANPHVTFTVPWLLRRRFGVPYVMDYQDAWSLDVFSGRTAHAPGSRVQRWEQRLLGSAARVWFVNDPIRTWYAERYPEVADRMVVVPNGVDPLAVHAAMDHRPALDPLVFGYLGTLSTKVPVREFLAGWRRAQAGSARLAQARAQLHGRIGFYARPDDDVQALLAEAVRDGVRYEGPVRKADVARVYDGIDVLLLVLATGRYVTSGKVYEYMATGLPIVSVHDPGNAASSVLADYPLWFPSASLAAADVAAALEAAADAAPRVTPEQRERAQRCGDGFGWPVVLQPPVAGLRALTTLVSP